MTVGTFRSLLSELPDETLVQFVGAVDGVPGVHDFMCRDVSDVCNVQFNGGLYPLIVVNLVPDRREITLILDGGDVEYMG